METKPCQHSMAQQPVREAKAGLAVTERGTRAAVLAAAVSEAGLLAEAFPLQTVSGSIAPGTDRKHLEMTGRLPTGAIGQVTAVGLRLTPHAMTETGLEEAGMMTYETGMWQETGQGVEAGTAGTEVIAETEHDIGAEAGQQVPDPKAGLAVSERRILAAILAAAV